MNRSLTGVLAAALVGFIVLSGCDYDQYELTMAVEGDHALRTIVLGHSDNKPPTKDAVNALTRIYGEPQWDGQKATWKTECRQTTPNDLDGQGGVFWTRSSPLGSMGFYSETFEGSLSQAKNIESLLQETDDLLTLVREFLEWQFPDSPGRARLLSFLQTQGRDDVRDLATLAFLFFNRSMNEYIPHETQADAASAWPILLQQFLINRGYINARNIEELQAVENASGEVLTVIWHNLCQKLSLPEDSLLVQQIDLYCHGDLFSEDMTAYLNTRSDFQEFKETLRQKQAEAQTQPATAPVSQPSEEEEEDFDKEAMSQFLQLQNKTFMAMLGTFVDQAVLPSAMIGITLELPEGSYVTQTNGEQENDRSNTDTAPSSEPVTVKWSGSKARRITLPPVIFASWTTPNREFQQAHFGKVVVQGSPLYGFMEFYRSLDLETQGKIDALLQSMTPENYKELLTRFCEDPANAEQASSMRNAFDIPRPVQ